MQKCCTDYCIPVFSTTQTFISSVASHTLICRAKGGVSGGPAVHRQLATTEHGDQRLLRFPQETAGSVQLSRHCTVCRATGLLGFAQTSFGIHVPTFYAGYCFAYYSLFIIIFNLVF